MGGQRGRCACSPTLPGATGRSACSHARAWRGWFVPQDDFTPEQNKQNQQLFEDQQQMLESEVERLSNLVRARDRGAALQGASTLPRVRHTPPAASLRAAPQGAQRPIPWAAHEGSSVLNLCPFLAVGGPPHSLACAQTEQCNLCMNAGQMLEDAQRVAVINSTVSIERRIVKFFGMVHEILDQLQTCSAHIAS